MMSDRKYSEKDLGIGVKIKDGKGWVWTIESILPPSDIHPKEYTLKIGNRPLPLAASFILNLVNMGYWQLIPADNGQNALNPEGDRLNGR